MYPSQNGGGTTVPRYSKEHATTVDIVDFMRALRSNALYTGRNKYLASRWIEVIVPLLNPPPTVLTSWCHIWDFMNLTKTVWSALEIPRGSAPPNLQAHPSCFSKGISGLGSYILSNTSNSWLPWAQAAARLDSQLGFPWESRSPAGVAAATSDCFTVEAGCPRQNTGVGWPWPVPPKKPQGQHTQWIATDQVR